MFIAKFLILLLLSQLIFSKNEDKEIIKAILQIVENFNVDKVSVVNLKGSHENVVSELLASFEINVSVLCSKDMHFPTESTLIIVFAQSYNDFFELFKPQLLKKTSFCLIILQETFKAQQIFEYFWSFMISNVNVLVRAGEYLSMLTFFPFTEISCNDTSLKKINEFDRTWKTKDIFPKKFKNLHECQLNTMTYQTPPAVMIKKLSNGSYEMNGFEGNLFTDLSRYLNFSINFILTTRDVGTGAIYTNGKFE